MWNKLIQLSFRSKISLQTQIREMLVSAILDGHIPVGTPLPSTRALAEQLGVARNTVWSHARASGGMARVQQSGAVGLRSSRMGCGFDRWR